MLVTRLFNKNLIALIGLLFLLNASSGCAVVMALKQPSEKNLQVLNAGVKRENVITYLGPPISSEMEDGKKVEIYQFVQGYSGAVKASRALWHGLADLFTLFIWEIIGTPAEAIFDGDEMTVKVIFDNENRVEDVIYLKTEPR